MNEKLNKSQINRLAWHMAMSELKPGKGRSRKCRELWPTFVEIVSELSETGVVGKKNFEEVLRIYR